MTPELEDPLDALAPLIGQITIRWNAIHFLVFWLFRGLMMNQTGAAHAIFFAVKTERAQRDITLALAKHELGDAPQLLTEVLKTLGALGTAASRRNDILHAMLGTDDSGNAADIIIPLHHRLRGTPIKAQLSEFVGELERIYVDFNDLCNRLDAYLAKERDRHARQVVAAGLSRGLRPPARQEATHAEEDPQDGRKGRPRRPRSSQE